ncbi:hypothetical protein PIROE2DRAFT_5438 [Piromyces sp. E2]|nr:hypothetical protein PIROE2DRAFT_5438 [Piromyces sp. E2]|eukprot:OUM67171.1 hypothetical protein PIROE2DRAFT_5438 [Piromyces sp. E2]
MNKLLFSTLSLYYDIPKDGLLTKFKNLEYLNLENNDLDSSSPLLIEAGKLNSLKELILNKNSLEKLPEEFNNLTNLKTL